MKRLIPNGEYTRFYIPVRTMNVLPSFWINSCKGDNITEQTTFTIVDFRLWLQSCIHCSWQQKSSDGTSLHSGAGRRSHCMSPLLKVSDHSCPWYLSKHGARKAEKKWQRNSAEGATKMFTELLKILLHANTIMYLFGK